MTSAAVGAQEASSETLFKQVLSSDSLPVVPAVAANVLALSRDPDVNFSRLEEMISADPALVAKLLRMGNSAYFGSRKKVTSINEAVVRMGLKVTRMTVLSFCLEADISPKVPESFEIDRFWRHALTTAVGARTVAERIWPAKRDDAFAAGILQDIGMVALQCAMPELYAKVFEERRTHPTLRIEEIEQRVLGFTHARVGAELLRKWGIPEEVYGPVRFHHDPDGGAALGADPDTIRLARVLRLCSKISHFFYSRARGVIASRDGRRGPGAIQPDAGGARRHPRTGDPRRAPDLRSLQPGPAPDSLVRRGPPQGRAGTDRTWPPNWAATRRRSKSGSKSTRPRCAS